MPRLIPLLEKVAVSRRDLAPRHDDEVARVDPLACQVGERVGVTGLPPDRRVWALVRSDSELHGPLVDVLAVELKLSFGAERSDGELDQLASPGAPVLEVGFEWLEEVRADSRYDAELESAAS